MDDFLACSVTFRLNKEEHTKVRIDMKKEGFKGKLSMYAKRETIGKRKRVNNKSIIEAIDYLDLIDGELESMVKGDIGLIRSRVITLQKKVNEMLDNYTIDHL